MRLGSWRSLKASLTRLRGSVRLRLLLSVMLFSSVVTLTLTTLQLYLEYRHGLGVIESRLADIHDSYLGGLSEGLWRLDREYLQIQLDGILRLADIRAVEVRETAYAEPPLVVRAGRPERHTTMSRQFPIFYRVQGRDQRIGTLYVEATLGELYRQLMNTALVILVSQGLKTFLVSLFIIYIVHRLITRHLAVLADFAHGYDLAHRPPPLQLPRPAHGQEDELEEVVSAINAMNTGLQRAYDELREREARIRRLMDANIIGIVFWHITGAISEANDAFLALVGYSREDLRSGRVGWKDLTPPEYEAADLRATEELMASGACRPYEKEFIRQDGSRVPVLLAGALFEGSRERGVAFFLDLSERRQAEAERRAREAAEAANRAKSEFLANMSHELRSPLNTILGFARLMTEDPALPESVREDLALIMKSGEHLHDLINQVLDLSKLEAGHIALEEVDFDLELLLDDLRDMFTPAAVGKGLQLVFAPRGSVPPRVHADPLKLRQVLINLLDNALKFTRQGAVTVELAVLERGEDSCRLGFTVADTGPGIAPHELRGLFEAFVQTETGRHAQQGTGLGLAISRAYVRLMGGELHVSSEVGKGTVFHFDLPARIAAATAPGDPLAAMPRRPVGLAPGEPRYRILVVDDHVEARQLLLRLLAPLGFELNEAGNGQEAVERWRDWQPDLIWTDLRMPVLDGRAAARRIRAESRDRRPVIIAITASAFEEERADILAAGFDDFLRKPFREADLFALMEKHLGAHYVYQEEAPPATPPLDPQSLAALPEPLRASLARALIGLDAAAVDQAIADIRARDERLAAALAASARDFQYERILACLEPCDDPPDPPSDGPAPGRPDG